MSGNHARIETHAEWLDRGNIFARIPISTLSDDPLPRPVLLHGPGLLVTRDCQLDKPKPGSTEAKIERLYFLPLISAETLEKDQLALIRKKADALQPFDPLYLGPIPAFGESFVLMSHTVQVPSSFCGVVLKPFEVGGPLPDWRAVATRNDTRLGTLTQATRALLEAKWSAFWLGEVAK